MGGLFGTLNLTLKTLSNVQTGMSVVNENVANVNTPGYSRKRMVLDQGPYELRPYGLIGSGANIQRIESIRDVFLERRITVEYEAKGFYDGQHFGVSQLETVLAPGDGLSISDQITQFFNSFLELASEPSSLTLRGVVVGEGEALANRIRLTADQLDALDLANQVEMEDSVNTINDLLNRIGQINEKLLPILAQGQDGGPLYDDRQLLLNQLSQEMGVQIQIDDSNDMTIATSTGRLLVFGSEVTELSVLRTGAGMTIQYEGTDITSEIAGGRLAGYLNHQGETLASARSSLNELARELVLAVNTAHANGVDLDGTAGGQLFSVNAGSESRTIQFLVSDPRQIAAGAPGSGVGDGSNAQAIADLRDVRQAGLGNTTFNEYFSHIVFDVGLAARSVEANLELQSKVLQHLESARESVSGVSLDEEAINLLQYQRTYQAGAKLVRAIDSLLEETINMIG